MAEDFDVSKYLQGISVGAPDSSFDSDGFNTDLFGSSSGSGFNDEGFKTGFQSWLNSQWANKDTQIKQLSGGK